MERKQQEAKSSVTCTLSRFSLSELWGSSGTSLQLYTMWGISSSLLLYGIIMVGNTIHWETEDWCYCYCQCMDTDSRVSSSAFWQCVLATAFVWRTVSRTTVWVRCVDLINMLLTVMADDATASGLLGTVYENPVNPRSAQRLLVCYCLSFTLYLSCLAGHCCLRKWNDCHLDNLLKL